MTGIIVNILLIGVPSIIILSVLCGLYIDYRRNKRDTGIWDEIREWRGKKPGEPFSITDEEFYAFIHYKKK